MVRPKVRPRRNPFAAAAVQVSARPRTAQCLSYRRKQGTFQSVYRALLLAEDGHPAAEHARAVQTLTALASWAESGAAVTGGLHAHAAYAYGYLVKHRDRVDELYPLSLRGAFLMETYATLQRELAAHCLDCPAERDHAILLYDCALNVACLAALPHLKAIAIQRAWRHSRYNPDGALCKRWRADVVNKHGLPR